MRDQGQALHLVFVHRLAGARFTVEALVVHPASPLTPGTEAIPGRRCGRCRRRRPQTNGCRCPFQ